MHRFPGLLVAVAACLVAGAPALGAQAPMWGPAGHAATAAVAQGLLTPAASEAVDSILGGASMASVASWADDVRNELPWSAPLHFADTAYWQCNYKTERDCANNVCVVGAIANYTQQLNGTEVKGAARAEALKFLIHFLGDIHQPLHLGWFSDKGGNDITGTFYEVATNLHHVWDFDMPDKVVNDDFSGSQTKFQEFLLDKVLNEWAGEARAWTNICPQDEKGLCPSGWANESVGYACCCAYLTPDGNYIKNGFELGADYFDAVKSVLLRQIAKGGVRLAVLLNNIFAK